MIVRRLNLPLLDLVEESSQIVASLLTRLSSSVPGLLSGELVRLRVVKLRLDGVASSSGERVHVVLESVGVLEEGVVVGTELVGVLAGGELRVGEEVVGRRSGERIRVARERVRRERVGFRRRELCGCIRK